MSETPRPIATIDSQYLSPNQLYSQVISLSDTDGVEFSESEGALGQSCCTFQAPKSESLNVSNKSFVDDITGLLLGIQVGQSEVIERRGRLNQGESMNVCRRVVAVWPIYASVTSSLSFLSPNPRE